MVMTDLGVSSRACLGLRTAPANAWGLAVSWMSGREWTEDRMDRIEFWCWIWLALELGLALVLALSLGFMCIF